MYTDFDNFDSILKFISSGIGVRPVGSNGLRMTRDYIEKKFRDFGLVPTLQRFKFEEMELDNVIASVPPQGEAEKVIVFVAHYDSVPVARGSMDNASGVSVVLELARVLKQNLKLKHTELRFIALAGEEVGCVGSLAYLATLSEHEKSKIYCAVNFDMFMSKKDENSTLVVNTMGGYNENNEFIVGTDEKPFDSVISKAINECVKMDEFANIGKIQSKIWSPRNYGHSDHQSFFENKIDSANVTIRGAREINGKLPSGYHTERDFYNKAEFNFEQAKINLELVYYSVIKLISNLE
ncbi:MAG: M28 family metallopeptidase [Clostridia bacterium]